eukprot:287170_1
MAEQKDEQKDELRNIVVWNLWPNPIQVRMQTNEFVITDNYKKDIHDVYSKKSKSGSGGVELGIGDVKGGLKGSGSSDNISKTHDEVEIKQKIDAYLKESGFQTINTNQPSTFALQSPSKINFVSIIVDGVEQKHNWNNSDPEIVVEVDGMNHDVPYINSYKKQTLAEYFDSDKIFSSSYAIKVKAVLSNFQKLYNFGKQAKFNGKNILSDKTISQMARDVLDFRGVGLAVSDLISTVSQIFFGESLTGLYNHINQTDLSKLDKDLVKAQLYKIGKQANDIAHAFKVSGNWYFQISAEMNKVYAEILHSQEEVTDAKDITDIIKDLTSKMNSAYNNWCDVCDKMKWAIPISWLTWISGSATTGALVSKRNGYWSDYQTYKKQLATFTKAKSLFLEVSKLSDSVSFIGSFCHKVSSWFTQHGGAYSNFGKQKSTASDAINDEWKVWSTEKCVEWILGLEGGYFKSYKESITSGFTEQKIVGTKLPKLGIFFFEQFCKMEEHDASVMVKEIGLLKEKSSLSFALFKSNYDDDMKWITGQKVSLKEMSNLLTTAN